MIYKVDGHSLVIQTQNNPETDVLEYAEKYLTAGDIVDMHDEEYRNQVSLKTKMRFLEEIERLIQKETIDTHETKEGYDPRAHFLNFGPETELYAYAPYHILYVYYIQMRIASIQNDTKRLNMLAQQYNDAYITFQQQYNRTHMRRQEKTPYVQYSRGVW